MMGTHVAAGIAAFLQPVFRNGLPIGRAIVVAFSILPTVFAVHANRQHVREKHLLVSQLKHFDVRAAGCRLERDREFIYAAIQSWYGGPDAFNEHVRGPLRDELLHCSMTGLPLRYALLICFAPLSIGLDGLAEQVRAGAPTRVLLCQLCLQMSLSGCWMAVSLNVTWRLCARFAAAPSSKGLDYVATIFIFATFALFYSAGAVFVNSLYRSSLLASVACSLFFSLLVPVAYGKCRCSRQARRS